MNLIKRRSSILAVAVLVLAGAGLASKAAPLTNATLKGTFTLTAYVQEDTNSATWTISTRHFGNADIVNAIAGARSLSPSDYNPASLIMSSTILVPNQHLGFYLRSTAGNDLEVSTNLSLSIPDRYQSITSIRAAPFGVSTNSVDLTMFEFVLNTADTTFDLIGAATLNSTSVSYKGRVIDKYPFTSQVIVNVAGAGTLNGKNAVFKGTFRASGRAVEIWTAHPQLGSAARVDGTNMVITGFNGSPSYPFYILTSSDLNAPFSNWAPVRTNTFDSNGRFILTNAIDPTVPQQFFILSAP
jgi:hypothetical protein